MQRNCTITNYAGAKKVRNSGFAVQGVFEKKGLRGTFKIFGRYGSGKGAIKSEAQ